MGITSKDLFPRADWNFIQGLGDKSMQTGVVSTLRHKEWLGHKLN